MPDLLKKDRELVIPGDKIVDSMDYLPGKNCYREGNSLYAKKLGLVSVKNRVISVIPLNSVYIPKVGDMVVGEIEEIQSNGWVVNINSPYPAYLPLSGVKEFIDTSKTDLSKVYNVGDIIYAKVSSFVQSDSTHVSMQDIRSRKFRGGRVIKINPAKVPRLIGKQGSMIKLIKEKTGCRISVGQNGLIWIEGDNIDTVLKVTEIIEKESQTNGLTDRISKMLTEKTAKAS